jgi:hypothetical protein
MSHPLLRLPLQPRLKWAPLWLAAGLAFTVGCKKQPVAGSGETTAVSAAPAVSAVAQATTGAPVNLEAAQVVPGTPISLRLPKGAKRLGRSLIWLAEGPSALGVKLSYRTTEADAQTTIGSLIRLYEAKGLLRDASEPVAVGTSGKHYVVFGSVEKDVAGRPGTGAGLLSVNAAGGGLLITEVSFAEGQKDLARSIAENAVQSPGVALDALSALRVGLTLPKGFVVRPESLEPLYVSPKPEADSPLAPLSPVGPSLELRVRPAAELESTFSDLIPRFIKDAKAAKCEDVTWVAGATGRDCSLVSDTGPSTFQVRMFGVKDAGGSVIVIVRSAVDAKAEQHQFDVILKSLTLNAAS